MQDLTNVLLLLRDFSMVQMAFMGVAGPPTESKTFSLGFCFFMSITLSYLKSVNLYNMLNKQNICFRVILMTDVISTNATFKS